jgi:hypothetical protein
MRKALLLVVVGLLLVSVGCVMTGSPASGMVYTGVKGPGQVIDNSVACTKTGTSEASGIIFFATGDASISAAMQKAGITKVHHVDQDFMSVLNVYAKTTTTVYGE